MVDIALDSKTVSRTPLEKFYELDKADKEKESIFAMNPDTVKCSDALRARVDEIRASSLSTLSIYSELFVANDRLFVRFFFLTIAIIVQTLIPAAIIWSGQPLESIEETPKACPNESSGFTKLLGLTLCLFFVQQTNNMCNFKLTGLLFLRQFCNLGWVRRLTVELGILINVIGMTVAGGAQFLLFVGNGRGTYLILLLQSLAMQFCLSVDTKVVIDPDTAKKRIKALTEGALLCDGVGIGEPGQLMPTVTAKKLMFLCKSETAASVFIMFTGFIWSGALAYCI